MGVDTRIDDVNDVPPHPRIRKRTRINALVPALLLCCGAAVMCSDMMGISSNNSTTAVRTSAGTPAGERKNDYRRLVDRETSSLSSSGSTSTANSMAIPSISDVVITHDGMVTTYDLWYPDDNGDQESRGRNRSGPRPLVIMQTKPNNWMFGHHDSCCAVIQSYLGRGIAVASVVIDGATDKEGHQSMAVDFLISKAEEHGVDPERITLHEEDDLIRSRQVRKLGQGQQQGHDANLESIVARTMMHWAAIPPTYSDVPYVGKGSGGERTLDFWEAEPFDESDTGRRPVVLYIHGGGWLSDDKTMLDGRTYVDTFLQKGISFASINYRKTTDSSNALPVPVHDAARAVKFLKNMSKEWNLDRDRIALAGFSAGACTIMWMTFAQDLANPESEDPVERESTRVAAAAILSGQATIDPKEMMQWIGPGAATHPMLFSAVGEPNYETMMDHYDKHLPLFRQFSPIHHIERGEWGELGPPPLFMRYGKMTSLPSTDPILAIHHPKFGILLKERCDRVDNVECHLWIPGYPGYGAPPKEYPSAADFLYDKLGVSPSTSIVSDADAEEVS
mmetsp:Transcript_13661/g.39179  ORF Transcript_13661/g.39179 Transcript_13661/m.39179 type:complete len:563 (-) Transcript_13661:89-1777(-)